LKKNFCMQMGKLFKYIGLKYKYFLCGVDKFQFFGEPEAIEGFLLKKL